MTYAVQPSLLFSQEYQTQDEQAQYKNTDKTIQASLSPPLPSHVSSHPCKSGTLPFSLPSRLLRSVSTRTRISNLLEILLIPPPDLGVARGFLHPPLHGAVVAQAPVRFQDAADCHAGHLEETFVGGDWLVWEIQR